MSSGLVQVIKSAAMEAVDNSKPADLRFGTVISVAPLKIEVTNQFVIPKSMLIVPEHLTDYEIETTILDEYGWVTQVADLHVHDILHDRKKIIIHGALKLGDRVILLRKPGGQFYLVVDRLPKGEGVNI